MLLIRLAKFVTAGFLAVVPFAAMPRAAVAEPLLGWTGFEKDQRWTERPKFVLMLLDWVIAAGAALFGAPFWFDVLQRFVQLRGTGRPPSESASAAITGALSPGSL
jgi:hypothetical protein